MLRFTIKLAVLIIGGLVFAACLWQVVPFAEPRPLRMPTTEEWSKPYGPDYAPPAKDHLPPEYYQQPFDPESHDRE